MRGRMDCTVVALNIVFSCILNNLNKFYYFFFCTISIHPRIEQYPKYSRKNLQQSQVKHRGKLCGGQV